MSTIDHPAHVDLGHTASYLVPRGTPEGDIAKIINSLTDMLLSRYPRRSVRHRRLDDTRGVLKAR